MTADLTTIARILYATDGTTYRAFRTKEARRQWVRQGMERISCQAWEMTAEQREHAVAGLRARLVAALEAKRRAA